MLTHLTIQHFVLIDKLDLSFDKGLSVFTGETGAGKSILLDALSLVLGTRGETRFVRKGEKQAIISATFHLNKNHPVHEILTEQGLESDEELILRRTLSTDGKSSRIGFVKKRGRIISRNSWSICNTRVIKSCHTPFDFRRLRSFGKGSKKCSKSVGDMAKKKR